jgi:hypothetical protein
MWGEGMEMKLPEMPEGDVDSYMGNEAWTAEQMRAYGKLCFELGYKMGMEDAAKIAEQKRDEWLLVKWPDNLEDFGKRMVASIASAIRQQGERG